jgi:hypothetical protein
MSSDREKLTQLLQKVDTITSELSKILDELRTVSASLKSLSVEQLTQPPINISKSLTPPVSVVSTDTSKQRSVDDIRMSFPEELESRLSFDEKGDYIIIKPKMFLGSENFAKIASAVRGMGGEYISAGKESHFRVPKKKT